MKRVAAFLLLFGTVGYGQRIKDIATVAGLRYVHLKGIGIVAGLNGTGDSPKNFELQQKFQRILRYWGGGENQLSTKNLALVLVTATVPSSTKPGQTFPVSVASIGDAKDLSGGELLECALRGPITPLSSGDSDEVAYTDYAVAQGKVVTAPNAKVKTGGGSTAILEREFGIPFHSNFEHVTLFLNQPDFNTANSIASAINNANIFGAQKAPLAQAIDASTIQVRIPADYLKGERVVQFVSNVLSLSLEAEGVDRQAKVIIDRRTGTVVVNGEVRVSSFSAVVDGLVVRIPAAGEDPAAAHPRLIDILAEFRKQNLAAADIITVLKGMDQAGVLQGTLVEE